MGSEEGMMKVSELLPGEVFGQLDEFVISLMGQHKYEVTFSYNCPSCGGRTWGREGLRLLPALAHLEEDVPDVDEEAVTAHVDEWFTRPGVVFHGDEPVEGGEEEQG